MLVDIPECPTLYPSFKEFKKFDEYVNKVEQQYRHQFGMVKVSIGICRLFRQKNGLRKPKIINRSNEI